MRLKGYLKWPLEINKGISHMIKISAITFIILLTACATEENDNQQTSSKLTGTWVSTSVSTAYDNSNLLIGSETTYSTFYFTESNSDIQMSSCEDYSNPEITPAFLQKNSDILSFVNVSDTQFSIVNTTELTREYEVTHSFGKTLYNQTLTKISSAIDLSRGSFELNGQLSESNQTHVCLEQSFSSGLGQDNRQQISVPFDNRYLSLNLSLTELLTVGNYQYDVNEAVNSPVLYSFNVSSNADMFLNTIGTNTLSLSQAILQVTSVADGIIEGSFSFVSQNSGSYTGSFSFVSY